jgi:hypothetical protein
MRNLICPTQGDYLLLLLQLHLKQGTSLPEKTGPGIQITRPENLGSAGTALDGFVA